MKCLSLWQPWASLIAVGWKRYETRSWSTPYRGPLLIHAAKTQECMFLLRESVFHRALFGDGDEVEIPFGQLLCLTELLDCIPTQQITTPRSSGVSLLGDAELAFGDYSPGRFAWKLGPVRVLPEPMPFRGQQGLWDASPQMADQIRAMLDLGSKLKPALESKPVEWEQGRLF